MTIKQKVATWAAKRFREPSTWYGIIGGACAAFGWSLDIAERDAIANVLAPLLAAVLIFTREDKSAPKQ